MYVLELIFSIPFGILCNVYRTSNLSYQNHRARKPTSSAYLLRLLFYSLIFLILFSTLHVSNAQTLDNDKLEVDSNTKQPTQTKQKDKLWKRILRSLYEVFYPPEEPDDDPLEKDPKFLSWKILLKIFLLLVLYTSIPTLPNNYRPMAYCYGIYLIMTLIMWINKCLEAYSEYQDKDEL